MFVVLGGSSLVMLGRGLDRLAVQSLKHGGRAVVAHTTTYVAFDNSKDTLAVAIADGCLRGEVRFWGTIPNQPEAVRKLVTKLAAKHPVLGLCYEAGPCGYGLYRQILSLGHPCLVVAPSLIPTKPGGPIKTDRRDATMLASLFRAGDLSPRYRLADHVRLPGIGAISNSYRLSLT